MTDEERTRYWNGDESVDWLVYRERYERMLTPRRCCNRRPTTPSETDQGPSEDGDVQVHSCIADAGG